MTRWTLHSVCLMLVCFVGHGGWIEDRDGKTIIHVEAVDRAIPDPSDPSVKGRADAAVVKLFKQRFAEIFRERYLAKYKADPQRYGKHNWDNVEVQLHKSTGIRVEGVETDLLQIAGDMAPDILYVNFRKSYNYIHAGFLYPLDKPEDGYLSSMSQEEVDFRIHEKIWPVIKRRGPQGNKQVWALPYGGALGRVLIYRKDLFDQHKLKYPDAQWTWDDLLHACRKISDPAKGIYGIGLGQGPHESWYWVTFLWSAGAEVMVYDEAKNQWSCTFDTPEAAQALDIYTRLSSERWVDSSGKVRRGYAYKDVNTTLWARGQIGIRFDYVDEKLLSAINPEVTGMAPVPLGPSGMRGAELNSRMMGLFAKIKHPAVRDAAWEYMRFYESIEAMRLKTKIMVEGGLGQFMHPRYLRMFGYNEIERLAPKGWVETFEIAIATGKPEPYGKNSNTAYNKMTEAMNQADTMMKKDLFPMDNEAKRLKMMREILVQVNASANDEMMGIVSGAERLKRRVVAVLVLVAIATVFFFVFRKIFRLFTPENPSILKGGKWQFRKYAWAYILLLPACLSILVWRYVPLVRGSCMAFFDYQILLKSTWVGVDNFGDLLFELAWWEAVWHALRYSTLVMAFTFLPPIVLAILLQEVPKGKILFRTIFYLPAVMSGLVTILLWKQFYQRSENGALNAIMMWIPGWGFVAVGLLFFLIAFAFARRLMVHNLRLPAAGIILAGVILFFGITLLGKPILFPSNLSFVECLTALPRNLFSRLAEPYDWLGDPDTAMLSCIVPMIWAGMGPGCLIYLAALKGIPDDYYEAADIDGATFIDKILFIVFPMLKALIIINFVGVFIGSWYSATGNILMMTGGGANTKVAGLYIWYEAFTYLKFGPATAMAWMLGFMLIGFTVYQLRMLSRVEFRAAGKEK